jgi:hypothetical protein
MDAVVAELRVGWRSNDMNGQTMNIRLALPVRAMQV